MTMDWKDVASTVSVIVVALIAIGLMTGLANDIDGRWSLATYIVFIVAGITGLMTGTSSIMRHAWSKIALYVLSAAVLISTVVNAFANSEVWFIVSVVAVGLIWAEFITTHIYASRHIDSKHTHTPQGV